MSQCETCLWRETIIHSFIHSGLGGKSQHFWPLPLTQSHFSLFFCILSLRILGNILGPLLSNIETESFIKSHLSLCILPTPLHHCWEDALSARRSWEVPTDFLGESPLDLVLSELHYFSGYYWSHSFMLNSRLIGSGKVNQSTYFFCILT